MRDSPSLTDSADASICGTTATSGTADCSTNGRRFGGNAVCSTWGDSGFVWLVDRGLGYLPVTASPYDAAYFEKYRGYASTPVGRLLNRARLSLVWRYWHGPVIDVGIGSGQFVEAHQSARGVDVNPAGVAWLRERGLFADPLAEPFDAATFWDSLEHIPDPAAILANVRRFVFVALPIFDDLAHVLRSKHFRRDEHCWYFTAAGFVAFMSAHGFECLERNAAESEIGREDIQSFAFERRRA